MRDSFTETRRLFSDGRYMDALAILDRLVERDSSYYKLRALCREMLSDLANALDDIVKHPRIEGDLSWLIEARILAKLGYVDEANEIITKHRGEDVPNDDAGTPFTHGVAYQYFDLKRNGFEHSHNIGQALLQQKDAAMRNGIIYGLELAGYFDELIEAGFNVEGIKKWVAVDSMPKGVELESVAIAMEQKLVGIRGWLSPFEAATLYHFANRSQLPVIEIGSFYGRSAVALGLGCRENGNKVFAIDPHAGIEAYKSKESLNQLNYNLSRFRISECVEIIRATSLLAYEKWNHSNVGLIFIDALHDYENVKDDFMRWSQHLANGGVILFHDAVQSGVNRLLREIIHMPEWNPLGLRDSIFAFQKLSGVHQQDKVRFYDRILKQKGDDYNNWESRDKKIISQMFSGSYHG